MTTTTISPNSDLFALLAANGIDATGKTIQQVQEEFEANRDPKSGDQRTRLAEVFESLRVVVDWTDESEVSMSDACERAQTAIGEVRYLGGDPTMPGIMIEERTCDGEVNPCEPGTCGWCDDHRKAQEADRDSYMDKQEYKRKVTATSITSTFCLCGCGALAARRFLPGHDAKLKGALIQANRDGEAVYAVLHIFGTSDPRAIASSLGWDHFLTPATPRVCRARTAEPKPKKVQAKVGRWQYEGEVRDGVFYYQDRQGNTLETTHFTLT